MYTNRKKRLRKKRGGFDPEEEAEYIAMAMKVNADHAKARAKAEAHAAKKREQERAKAAHHDKADAATKGEEDTSLKPKDKGKKRARDEDDGYTSGGDASVQATSTPKRPKTTEVQINQVVHEDIQCVASPFFLSTVLELTPSFLSGRVTNGFKESVLPSQTPSQAGPSTSSIAGAPQDFLKAVPNVNDIAPSERLAQNKVVYVASVAQVDHSLSSSSVVPTLTPESSTATQAVTRPTAEKANTPSPSLAPSGSSGDGARALKPIPKHTPGSLSRTRCVGASSDTLCPRRTHAYNFLPLHIDRDLRSQIRRSRPKSSHQLHHPRTLPTRRWPYQVPSRGAGRSLLRSRPRTPALQHWMLRGP